MALYIHGHHQGSLTPLSHPLTLQQQYLCIELSFFERARREPKTYAY